MDPFPHSDSSDDRPGRIAWLVQGDEGYGVRRTVLGLTRAVQAHGVEPVVVNVSDGAFAAECRALGMTVRGLQMNKTPRLRGRFVQRLGRFRALLRDQRRAAPRLIRVLAELGADALHVIWPNLLSLAGRAARARGVPCFWEMANYVSCSYPFQLNRRFYQSVCKRYRVQPLANSHYTARTLGDHPVRTLVCHLGADERQFDPQRVAPVDRAELGIDPAAIVFGIAARLNPSKGQDRVLTALARIGVHDPPLHLLLLGGPTDGAVAASLRSAAAEAGMTDRLHLAGLVADPHRYYGPIDIAVNSRVDAEPFGLSVVEAMLMARPVLAHALGGPAETVVDGVTGWHVPEPSVDAYVAGLRRVLDDRPRWDQMGRAARTRALEQFTTARQAERFLAAVGAAMRQGP